MVPALLAGLTAGTLLSVIYLSDVATIDGVPTGLPQLQRPSTSVSFLASALVPALTIALLSSLRGLVSSLAVDSQTRTREDPDRGLLSLGVGNVAAGLFGGLPGHMTFATTMLNMRMGGKTRVSTLMRVLALLLMVLGFGHYLKFIPHAALAGVLFIIGWEMIDWRFLARIHRVQREHLLIMLTTLGITLFVDLITAIAVGLIVSGMIGARQFERLQLDNIISVPLLDQIFLREEHPDEHGISPYSARVGLVKLRGSYTVASLSKLMRIIGDDIVGHQVVILDFSETNHIDDSAALVIEQLIDTAAASGTDCIVTGLSGTPAASLESLDVLGRVPRIKLSTHSTPPGRKPDNCSTARFQDDGFDTAGLANRRARRIWIPVSATNTISASQIMTKPSACPPLHGSFHKKTPKKNWIVGAKN